MYLRKIFNFILLTAFASSFALSANAQYLSDGKPVFVEISTDWCFACKMLKPTIEELKRQYAGSVTFIHLDPTSEESLAQSLQLAQDYGVLDFFNANRNAFPTVGILCSSSSNAEKLIVGANAIDEYKNALNNLLADSTKTCSLTSGASITSDRPDEAKFSGINGARPAETSHSGRPEEIRFWSVGEDIPTSEYYKFLVIPKCSPGNSVVCSNFIETLQQVQQVSASNDNPVFKPWDPNTTRNEKGFNQVEKNKK